MDLRINYSDYEDFLEQYAKQIGDTRGALECLDLRLADLLVNGVVSGKIHDELTTFREYTGKAAKKVDEIIDTMNRLIQEYLDQMNDAQCIKGKYILYKKEYPDTRDYSDAYFERLQSICDSTKHDANWFERFNDWGEDVVAGAIGWIGDKLNWFNVRQTQYLVMERNDITRHQLQDIQERLAKREVDFTAKADALRSVMMVLNQALYHLAQAVTWKDGNFSMSEYTTMLSRLFGQMDNLLTAIRIGAVYTREDIARFLELEHPENFFKDSSDQIYDYLAELSQLEISDGETWGMILTQMFTIASKELTGLITGDYDYQKYLMDTEMLALLDEMSKRESLYEGTAKETAMKTYKTFMEYIEKYGEYWEQQLEGVRDENGKLILDRRTTEYKAFKAFYEQFGNAATILDYGMDLCEIVAKYVADYEKNLEILATLEVQCAGNEAMAESLARIRQVYEKSWDAIAKDVLEKLLKLEGDCCKAYLVEMTGTSVFGILAAIKWGIDIIGNITGISQASLARLQLLNSGHDQLNTAKTAFEQALAALQAADPNSAEYEELSKEFARCFEYYRVTQKRLYEKMGEASSGVEGAYYRYCAEELDDLTLHNFDDFELMTMEEYKSR